MSSTFLLRSTNITGVTGGGKSTLVNCLAGCELRQVTREELLLKNLPIGALVVKSVAEGGPRDEVAYIGLSAKSKTEVLAHAIFL